MNDLTEERRQASIDFLRAYGMLKKLERDEALEEQEERAEMPCDVQSSAPEPYDAALAEGQIRLLPETERITYVLLLKRCGATAFLVVPFSRFSAPATDGELKAAFDGGLYLRVLQLWNVRILQRSTLRRSWLIGEMSVPSLQEMTEAWHAYSRGMELLPDVARRTGVPIWKSDDPRLDYKREEQQNFAAVEARDLARAENGNAFWLCKPDEEEQSVALAAGTSQKDIQAEFVMDEGQVVFAFNYSRKEQTLFCVVYDARGERTTAYDGCRLVDGVDGKMLGSVSNGRCKVVEYSLNHSGNCIILEDAAGEELSGEWRRMTNDGK